MKRRSVRQTVGVLVALTLCGLPAAAGGIYLGFPVATLDLSTTLSKLPDAVSNAFDVWTESLGDLGIPPSELTQIQQGFADAEAGVEAFADTFPTLIPIPHLGGGIEISLPLVVIDGIRFSGGMITDGLLRSGASLAGIDVPDPLADFDLSIGEDTGHVTADLSFASWILSTEAVKRFDLFLLGLSLGAGLDLIGGRVVPTIDYDLPQDLEDGVDQALAALHLDELTWSSFAVHGMIGFELGPPFLRLYGDVRWTISLSQREGWWGIRPGALSALLGFVIRF
jgi:hypothetical protein